MTHLLSVDPGNHSGWALWELWSDGRWDLVTYGRWDWTGDDAEQVSCDVWALLDALQGAYGIGTWVGSTLVVEGQWWNPRTGFDTVERLISIRAWWQAVCSIAGMECVVYSPSTWIKPVVEGVEGADSTKKITAACRRKYPGLPVTDDEAAAIMLGRWAILRDSGRLVEVGEGLDWWRGVEVVSRREL